MALHFKKFEIIFLGMVIIIITILNILYRNYWFATLNGILGLFSIFLQAKGLVIGQFVGIIDSISYGIFALSYNYIGEFIVYIFILVPIFIYGIIEWIMHRKGNKIIPNKIHKMEIVLLIIFSFILIISFYILLTYLNSDFIILNTLSIYTLTYANYLLSRRSVIGFVYYLFNDIVLITLWGIPLILGDLSLISFFICVIAYFICDIYGILNWRKLR